jgi:hypothetical protein
LKRIVLLVAMMAMLAAMSAPAMALNVGGGPGGGTPDGGCTSDGLTYSCTGGNGGLWPIYDENGNVSYYGGGSGWNYDSDALGYTNKGGSGGPGLMKQNFDGEPGGLGGNCTATYDGTPPDCKGLVAPK